MIGPFLWLIYLLTYSDTERALLVTDDGLVSMVWGKHGFSDEDQTLMKNLYVAEGYRTKQTLIKEFPNKGWGL